MQFFGDEWFDPLEVAVRVFVRGFIEAMLEQKLHDSLGGRYKRNDQAKSYRNGHRKRQTVGTFGKLTDSLPRAGQMAPKRIEALITLVLRLFVVRDIEAGCGLKYRRSDTPIRAELLDIGRSTLYFLGIESARNVACNLD